MKPNENTCTEIIIGDHVDIKDFPGLRVGVLGAHTVIGVLTDAEITEMLLEKSAKQGRRVSELLDWQDKQDQIRGL